MSLSLKGLNMRLSTTIENALEHGYVTEPQAIPLLDVQSEIATLEAIQLAPVFVSHEELVEFLELVEF
jgi:hypothetical protein